MARTVTLSLIGLNRLSKPLRRASKDVDGLDDQISDFNKSGAKLGKTFEDAGKSVAKLDEGGKALAKMREASRKAEAAVTKASAAMDKARVSQAQAAARTAAAEARLSQVRKRSKVTAEQIRAAELGVEAARVKEEAATNAVTTRTNELEKSQRRVKASTEEMSAAIKAGFTEADASLKKLEQDRTRKISFGIDGIGSSLGGLSKAGRKAASGLGSAFGSIGNNVWVMVAIVAAAMAALPFLGAVAGVAITAAFGAGIAGVGLFAAAQSEHVKEHFSDLKDHVVAEMREMARPLEGTLVAASEHMQGAFDELAPSLESAFDQMAPVLEGFSEHLFGALGDWGPVVDSATLAFTEGMEALGPEMRDRLGELGDSLIGLFNLIAENPDLFAGMIGGIVGFISGLVKTVTWLSEAYLWIQEKVPGGIMTLLSPLGSLTGHLLSTADEGGGLIDKMREMGDAFSEAFGFISDGASDLKETLGPIAQEVTDALANSNVQAKISEWWTKISEIVSLVGEAIGTAMSIAANVISFIWENFGSDILGYFSGLWTIISGVISGALDVIIGIFNTSIGVFTGDWARAWEGVKQIFMGLWTAIKGILVGAWGVITSIFSAAVKVVVGIFKHLYRVIVGNSIIPDLVNAVLGWFRRMRDLGAALIAKMRDWVVSRLIALKNKALAPILALRDRGVELLTSLRDRGRAMADNIRDWITSRVRSLRDNVSGAFKTLKDRSISAFTKAKNGIKDVWKKVEKAAKDPVNFVIETVYTSGIKKFWDSIAGKIDMKTLPSISPLATGGVLPGYRPGVDTIPAMLSEGEGVLVPQAVRALGPRFVHMANNLKGRAGELLTGVQGFARGGIAGAVGDFLAKGKDFFADGFMKAVRAVTSPISSQMHDKFGDSGLKGLPTNAVDHLIGKLHGFLSPFESTLSGGNGRKVAEVARDQVGISGRPNKFTRAPGMWTDEWCGMFVDWVFKKANAFDAISSVRGTPAVRNYTTLDSVSRSAMMPGDLALYRGNSGHINIVTDPSTGETVGGNESNSVRKQFGYVNSASSIRRPEFANGGIASKADLLAVLAQDRSVNTRMTTPALTTMRRRAAGMRHYATSLPYDTAPIARALGGPVIPGRTYRVGENGPEEMTVGTRATVTPIEYGNTYTINVNVPPGADKAAVGKAVVETIQEYERRSGKRWRE